MAGTISGEAIYLDGQAPFKRPAKVFISDNHIEFTADYGEGDPRSQLLHRHALSMVKVERVRHNFIHVHLNYENGERLEFSAQDLIDKITAAKPVWEVDITRNVGEKTFFFLLGVLALGSGLWFGTPWISKKIAHMIPVEQENRAAQYVLPQFKKEICDDEKAHRILQTVADRLLASSQINHPVKVYFGSNETVNAFALPGNIIIVYPGILNKMETPEALAGVVAHELQHQVQRHITAQIVRATLMTAIWQAALGDFSGILILDPSTVITIASAKYSRDAESEADAKGAELLKNAGIAVLPMLEFLEDLSKLTGAIPEFILSHPQEGRGQRLRAQYSDVKTTQAVMSDDDWTYLKVGCSKRPTE